MSCRYIATIRQESYRKPLRTTIDHALKKNSPFSWGCIICQLLLSRGVRPNLYLCLGYGTKPSDDEAPVLELWGM